MVLGGLALSTIGVLDPRLPLALWLGPALAALGALLGRSSRTALGTALAFCLSVAGFARPEFRADTGSYFVYLRSLAFDRDVDFANDWTLLGRPKRAEAKTATGLVPNSQTLGPALLWAPFFGMAHAYVRVTGALGLGSWAADGTSEPYRRAMSLGTVTAVLLAAWLLAGALARHFAKGAAVLAVAVAVLASPVVYYTFVVPGMAHGLAFALAALLLVAIDRARTAAGAESRTAWLVVGVLLGLLVLVRTQAAVLGLVVLPVAVRAWRRREVAPATLVAAGAISAALVLPQMLAWKALFGSFLTVPQGTRYLDWSAPHLRDVLFSANHGLFAGSPALALGLAGLVLCRRRDPALASGSLLAFFALAWTNGAVTDWDWEGGDAFGARRFDVAVPLLAIGLAAVATRLRNVAERRPLVLPLCVLGVFVMWNIGFVAIFRSGRYPEAAPLDRLARDQALLLRRVATGALGTLGGDRGRALAYDFFAGEYLFGALGRAGTLRLATADDRTVGPGFSPPAGREDGPAFRWAHHPEACLNLPLRGDRPLRAVGVVARAPRKALPQTVVLVLNGEEKGEADVGAEWTTLRFAVGDGAFRAGENLLCLRFARGLPAGSGDRPAAAVAEVRLAESLEDLGPAHRPPEDDVSPP